MTDRGIYNLRVSFKRRPRNTEPLAPRAGITIADTTPEHAGNAAAFEMLSSLRGVRPERLRAIYADTATTGGNGLSLRVAFADLPNKLRRR